MTLKKEDKDVLKVLVEKELEQVENEGEEIMISNSPFMNKVALDDSDLPFLKSVELYKEFLQKLIKKL
ncbi:MAG: hypothetical protein ABH824_03560 [Nanoarchaeota archaeon]|nr:hypothetical protein [Nanoarchaeota archaeon]MBU1632391.1 hypothetical protein [Nanoarchaeota archaeon]MBU1876695.1 hypothetical protein [Nanoarchaeota archaeon]